MPRALILGGTGVLGRAIARRMLEQGWQVDVTTRDASHLATEVAELGGTAIVSDRTRALDLERVIGEGADLVVDCLAHTAEDAALLARHLDRVEHTVMLSTKSVYADEQGRHGNSLEAPDFFGPVTEAQETVPAGRGDASSREGYGRNKVAAENLLLDHGAPVSVLRIGKVHGLGAARPREWVFVKRVLDDRPAVLLRAGTDQTAAAVNVAALVAAIADRPDRRILNAADPDAPSGMEIARAVATHQGHDWDELAIDEDAPEGLGAHPWQTPHPFVLDTSAARALGWEPVGTFAETVGLELDWLIDRVDRGDAPADPWFDRYLEYLPEDAWLLRRSLGL